MARPSGDTTNPLMKRVRMKRIVWATALLLAGCQPYSAAPAVLALPSAPDSPSEVQSFVSLVNQHRKAVGCNPLTWSDKVAAVASAHSRDMARNNYMSHTDSQGQSPFDRLRLAGIPFRAAAENIAVGQPTGRAVLQSWLASPGHREHIETCAYEIHGVGLTSKHWTHMMVRK